MIKYIKPTHILVTFSILLLTLFNPPSRPRAACSNLDVGGDYIVSTSCAFSSNDAVTIITDSSPNSNTGTPTETTIADGKYGKARSFDGTNDNINVNSSASLDLASTQGTFAAWIYPESVYNEAVTRYVFNWYVDADNYTRIFRTDAGKLRLLYKGSAAWKGYDHDISSNWQNQWHHVAMTWNTTSGELKLYFDGSLASTVTGTQPLLGTASNLNIGNTNWLGRIDDVRIYNYARSETQINEDMANGSITGSLPVSHWRMDDGYTNGVDNGNLTINADITLTINAGQTIIWNPSKSITINGSIAIEGSGQLKQGYIWVPDGDGDGWPLENNQVIADSQPTGYVRRNTMVSLVTDCDDSSYSTTNECCTPVTWYQDSDGDLYGNPSVTTEACDQPAGYVADNTDCYDSNANAKPGQTSCFDTNRGDGSYDYDCDSSTTTCNTCSSSCSSSTDYYRKSCQAPDTYCLNNEIFTSKVCDGTVSTCGGTGKTCSGSKASECITEYPCKVGQNKYVGCLNCTVSCR